MCQVLEELNHKNVLVVCVVCAPEGIKNVENKFPDVSIVTGAVDERLNKKAFIVPGLGDYGDRYFGTE